MSRWTEAQVLDALRLAVPVDGAGRAGGRAAAEGEAPRAYTSVSTDTRSLETGALFVALRGESFDAHDFLAAAAEAGARGAVVERVPGDAPPLRYYRVPDTLVALGRLARYRRRALGVPLCAIAGSNGKTTTKEMTRAVLSTRYRVHATTGNLNNLVGAPLTLLAAPDDAEVLVAEVGTNAFGEIARLAEIVEPDAAVITAITEEHLEGLGSIEGVLLEETTLLSRLRSGGVAVVADDPASLPERARSLARRARVAGWTERAEPSLRAEDLRVDSEGRVRFRWRGLEVTLPFGGRVHARNALLALAVAEEWGVEPEAAVAALAELEPPKMRGEVHRLGELTVIADCYNANPASLAAAVDTLESMPRRGGRVAVVGSMLEMGPQSPALHRESARALVDSDVDLIVGTGLFVPAFEGLDVPADRLLVAEDAAAAEAPLLERLRGDEVVLLKGSRGVALERLIPPLAARFGDEAAGPRGDGG